MKKGMFILFLMACMAVSAFGQTVKLDWPQQYRFHGRQIYGDNVIHPGASANVRGFEIGTVTHIDDELEDDFDVMLKSPPITVAENLCLTGGYGYILLPGMDVQEASVTLSLPGNFVSPSYTYSYLFPDQADSDGQIHTLGLDMILGKPDGITAMLTAQIEYEQGELFGQPAINDFTHILAGLTVNVPMEGFVLQPGVYYQHTFEEQLDPDDHEVWWVIGMQYGF